ncbi:uncharacterized protein LOC111715578 [Eurytemora carolleeae]|uniref:uncharacterized protein LOC111715578 n=1 Tax=Eurytemora carolleeae TaxID=1294199 RepID=UPI000C76D8F4|nr:uncharacterized protein LOC111715578 [Eurytemora carolleeae]|eukprot:XP_023346706.1 uncharacterized protein LOC111715578 [Eurytemora affinis]
MPNLKFVQVNGSTGVGHCKEHCIENGERCGTKTCKDLKQDPLLNHQGGVDCACPVGQVQDENGECQVEFTEGTNCAPGQIILPKALAARYTDVKCDADYSCEDKCSEGENIFNNVLETKFNQFNHKCSDEGKIKSCCLKSRKHAREHFLNKLSKVHIQLGVCVNNPCTAGTSLFVSNEGKLECFQLKSPAVIKCKDFLSIEDEKLTCEKVSGNLTPLSFLTKQKKDCARGRIWSSYRRSCVPTFG